MIVLPFLRRIAQHLHLAFRVVDGSVELLAIVRLHHFACVLRWLVASATISAGAHWLQNIIRTKHRLWRNILLPMIETIRRKLFIVFVISLHGHCAARPIVILACHTTCFMWVFLRFGIVIGLLGIGASTITYLSYLVLIHVIVRLLHLRTLLLISDHSILRPAAYACPVLSGHYDVGGAVFVLYLGSSSSAVAGDCFA